MSDGNKSHKPTPKRQQEFRKRGEIAQSRDLTSSLTLLAGVLGASMGAAASWAALCGLTRTAMSGATFEQVAAASRGAFVTAVGPVMVVSLVGCLLAGGLQLGWPPALKAPTFDFIRPFSFQGITQVLSPSAMARQLFGALAKVAVLGGVMVMVLAGELDDLATVSDPHLVAGRLGGAVLRLTLITAIAFAVLGVGDYLLARRRINAKMMMSTDEVRREGKEQEGDPQVKGHRRRRMRELAKRRVVAETRTADVVLVNPTHYAIALRYRAKDGGAPRVVAKGTDELAARIREAARAAGVPVVSRPPLARALWKLCPEGKEIPAPLFHAVAEVLAYVYRIRHGRRVS